LRVLQIHCSKFSYRVSKPTPVAEKPPKPSGEELEDVLVCFVCFEKSDEGRVREVLGKFVESLEVDSSRIGCRRVLLYPYAHLSRNLGSPRLAVEFIDRLREELQKRGFEAHRSPFGWYKEFTMVCKGHPLSEAYREF